MKIAMSNIESELNIHAQLDHFFKGIDTTAHWKEWLIDHSRDGELHESVAALRRWGKLVVANVAFDPASVEELSSWIGTAQALAIGAIKSATTKQEIIDAVDRAEPNLGNYLITYGHLPTPDLVPQDALEFTRAA